MAATPSESTRAANFLVFGVLALAAASRLVTRDFAPATVGHVVSLWIIVVLGHQCATTSVRRSRIPGVVGFLVGWFWMPIVALVPLALWWWIQRPSKRRSGEARSEAVAGKQPVKRAPQPPGGGRAVSERGAEAGREGAVGNDAAPSPEARNLLRTHLALKTIAERGEKLKQAQAPFTSRYGEGVIPALMRDDRGERGLYFEVGPWTGAAQDECLQWLALLRTSEREDVEVEVVSDAEVPDLVKFYAVRSLRVSFELEGVLAARWGAEGSGRHNSATLRRMTEEHLGRRVGQGNEGLTALDELVLEFFRPDQYMLPSTVLLLGSVFGEELIARYGGGWIVGADDPDDSVVGIPTPRGTLKVNVFGKIKKLFRHGIEHSTAAMAVGLADTIAGRPNQA